MANLSFKVVILQQWAIFDHSFRVAIYSMKNQNEVVFEKFENVNVEVCERDSGIAFDSVELFPTEVKLVDGFAQIEIKVKGSADKKRKKIYTRAKAKLGGIEVIGESEDFDIFQTVLKVQTLFPEEHAAATQEYSESNKLLLEEDVGHLKWWNENSSDSNFLTLKTELGEGDHKDLEKYGGQIPVSVTLVYEDKVALEDQSVLKFKDDAQFFTNGTAKYRIETTSSIHGKQKFRLEVRPDVSGDPDLCDIGPAWTRPIQILLARPDKKESEKANGKGKKRQRPTPTEAIDLTQDLDVLSNGDELHTDVVEAAAAVSAGAVGGGPFVDAKRKRGRPQGKMSRPPKQWGIQKKGPAYATVVQKVQSKRTELPQSKRTELPILPAPPAPKSLDKMGSVPINAAFGHLPDKKLDPERKPLGTVFDWTRQVLDLLGELSKEKIGQELGENRLPDLSRPIFRCPSCWKYRGLHDAPEHHHNSGCKLESVLVDYVTKAQPQMRELAAQIERLISTQGNANGKKSSDSCQIDI